MANRSQACSSGEAGAADAALSAAMPPTAGLSPRARAQRQPPEDSGPPGEARGSSREGGPAKALAKLLPQKPETGVSSGGGNPDSAPGGRSSSLSKTGSLTPAPPALCSGGGTGPRPSPAARRQDRARGAPGTRPGAPCRRVWSTLARSPRPPAHTRTGRAVRSCFQTIDVSSRAWLVARPQPRGSPLWRVPCSGMNPRGRGGAFSGAFPQMGSASDSDCSPTPPVSARSLPPPTAGDTGSAALS